MDKYRIYKHAEEPSRSAPAPQVQMHKEPVATPDKKKTGRSEENLPVSLKNNMQAELASASKSSGHRARREHSQQRWQPLESHLERHGVQHDRPEASNRRAQAHLRQLRGMNGGVKPKFLAPGLWKGDKVNRNEPRSLSRRIARSSGDYGSGRRPSRSRSSSSSRSAENQRSNGDRDSRHSISHTILEKMTGLPERSQRRRLSRQEEDQQWRRKIMDQRMSGLPTSSAGRSCRKKEDQGGRERRPISDKRSRQESRDEEEQRQHQGQQQKTGGHIFKNPFDSFLKNRQSTGNMEPSARTPDGEKKTDQNLTMHTRMDNTHEDHKQKDQNHGSHGNHRDRARRGRNQSHKDHNKQAHRNDHGHQHQEVADKSHQPRKKLQKQKERTHFEEDGQDKKKRKRDGRSADDGEEKRSKGTEDGRHDDDDDDGRDREEKRRSRVFGIRGFFPA